MLIKKIIDGQYLKLFLAAFIAYYWGLIVLTYNVQSLIILGVAVFIILFFKKIEYTFYFILASRTIFDVFFFIRIPGDIKISEFFGVLIIVLFIYYVVVFYRYHIFSLAVNKIYIIFLILSIPAIIISDSQRLGMGAWLRLFQGFIIFNITLLILLSAGNESYKRQIYMISSFIIISSILPYSLYIWNYMQGIYLEGADKTIRYSAFGAHYNVFSYLVFMTFIYSFLLYVISVRHLKIIWFIVIAITVSTIIITNTRNIWIAFLVVMLAWNLLRKHYVILSVSLSIVTLILILDPSIQDRLKDIYIVLSGKSFFELEPRLGSMRIGVWQGYIRYFLEQGGFLEKLFGNGYDVQNKISVPPYGLQMEAHNNFIYILLNMGIFPLCFYLLFIFKLFQESFSFLKETNDTYAKNIAQVFISLLFAYVSISMMTHIMVFTSIQYFFSVMAGFLYATMIHNRNNKKECIT